MGNQIKALRRRKQARKEANMHRQALRRKQMVAPMSKQSVLAARKPIKSLTARKLKKEGNNESNMEGAD